MNVRIITASAGTGKTTRLAELLERAVSSDSARPEAILATTFTKQAAAELQNRARTRLLQGGHGRQAQALLTARIGTVNAVCGSLVTDFSFQLGLSPELRVLDEAGAELELKRALASVVTDDLSEQLQDFSGKFDREFDWQYEVRRLVEAARANGIDAEGLATSADRSVASLDACLGPVAETADVLDQALREAMQGALAAIDTTVDTTVGTNKYCAFLRECGRDLARGRLRWGDWANLSKDLPTKKSKAHAAPVQAAAARHPQHPRLRDELHQLIRLMFDVASRGLEAYQSLKRERGLLDFVDQEVHALKLLSRPDIREVLREQLDLVLVDEFQDTSPLQLAIFLKLAELAAESVWVGDPKQAIFGFRGTDPALMDAAIESLASPSRDPDLVAAAVDAVASRSSVETLSTSYRSRPDLVAITNAIFARAFSVHQGMPEDRVRLRPDRTESLELGPAVSHWPLSSPARITQDQLAEAVAAGAGQVLGRRPMIWDRSAGDQRPVTGRDLAILCRTNKQCLGVSEALGKLGLASVVARVGLLETAEAQVLLWGLRLWVDPRDRLAAAYLLRILDHPEDAATFVTRVLDPEAHERLSSSAPAAAVLAARAQAPDLDVLPAIDVVIDALDLRRLCAGWGNEAQRTANLDALRAHASSYCDERRAGGDAPSLVGFLAYVDDLVEERRWGKARSDTAARVGTEDAITVSTWHAAKGLEWPIVILFGLESVRDPQAYGVHVLTDRATFDVNDPLGGRWIHFWPNPYTNSVQKGPIKEAYAASPAFRQIAHQGDREALRVLYVGWTRARDRLILAAQEGKLLEGLLGTLDTIEPGLIVDPATGTAGPVDANWAGHSFKLQVDAYQPAAPVAATHGPGSIRTGRVAGTEYPAATVAPSSAPSRPGRLGDPVPLGPPVRMKGTVKVDDLGTALHAFLAADDPQREGRERHQMAAGLLKRYDVAGALEAAELVELADRLWRWARNQFGESSVVRSEWPLRLRLDSGTVVQGTADLLVEAQDAIGIIDHKSFGLAAASARAEPLAGQLGCYADAVARARPGKLVSTWVHLPFDGVIVPLLLDASAPGSMGPEPEVAGLRDVA
jgi:ATP-dependent helicase/nuclease subunit A